MSHQTQATVTTPAEGVWCIRAPKPGPHVAFVGGTHGNELAGIGVVNEFLQCFLGGLWTLASGTLTLAYGNPDAMRLKMRATDPTRDLNRCFGSDLADRCITTPEAKRARILAEALKDVEIGIDLHATNLPSTPFLFAQAVKNERAKWVLSHFSPRLLLTDPNWVFAGGPSTLDEHFNRGDHRVGLCFEMGYAEDLSHVAGTGIELLNLLGSLDMVGSSVWSSVDNAFRKDTHELVEAIVPSTPNFVFTGEDTLTNFRPLAAGDLIGHDGRTPVIASHTGILVFPKAKHHRFAGKPVGYIARRV